MGGRRAHIHNETQREAEAGGGGGGRQRVFVVRWTKSVSQFGLAEEQIGLGRRFDFSSASRSQGEDDMKLLLLLLLCFGTLHVGSGLRCYKCQDYTGRCQNVQECTYEDSCISLSERGGKTIRQCIRYTDCDNSRLSQMFPAISAFTYRCCSSNLCNSGSASTAVTLPVALLGSLLSLWWCWM